jgi:hypothetical protein
MRHLVSQLTASLTEISNDGAKTKKKSVIPVLEAGPQGCMARVRTAFKKAEQPPETLYHPAFSGAVLQHSFLAPDKGYDHAYLRNITHQILHLAHEKVVCSFFPYMVVLMM